uniref:THAP-type domain-containing protein n=1 Tax=Glossina pallidipes TaxID=7398 RepID=A0A1B0A5X5_GLOPL
MNVTRHLRIVLQLSALYGIAEHYLDMLNMRHAFVISAAINSKEDRYYCMIMVGRKVCIVCKYYRGKSVENRCVFKIPANKLQNWLTILNASNDKKNYYICDKHFLQQYIKHTARNTVLAIDAVPTLHLDTYKKNSPLKKQVKEMVQDDDNIPSTSKSLGETVDYNSLNMSENPIQFPEEGNHQNSIQSPKEGNNQNLIEFPKDENTIVENVSNEDELLLLQQQPHSVPSVLLLQQQNTYGLTFEM